MLSSMPHKACTPVSNLTFATYKEKLTWLLEGSIQCMTYICYWQWSLSFQSFAAASMNLAWCIGGGDSVTRLYVQVLRPRKIVRTKTNRSAKFGAPLMLRREFISMIIVMSM